MTFFNELFLVTDNSYNHASELKVFSIVYGNGQANLKEWLLSIMSQ